MALNREQMQIFQSTHLMRGATMAKLVMTVEEIFQSTHLMRGATMLAGSGGDDDDISIHAPHARCDSKTIQKI